MTVKESLCTDRDQLLLLGQYPYIFNDGVDLGRLSEDIVPLSSFANVDSDVVIRVSLILNLQSLDLC